MQAVVPDLLGFFSAQYVADDLRTVALLCADNAGKDLLRIDRHIDGSVLGAAVGAFSAAVFGLVAEITQHERAQTALRFAVGNHVLQAFLFLLLKSGVLLGRHFGIGFGGIDKVVRRRNILCAEKQNAVGILSVSSGASCLLIVALDIFRHVVMDDKAHVAFVDSHAEGVRRYHDALAVIDEILLVFQAFFVRQTGVIACCRKALRTEKLADLLHLLACGTIDDAGFAAALFYQF